MKRNYFKKALIFTIVAILLGSGLVSGYNINNYNSKSNSKPNSSEKIDYIFNEEFPTMPPIDLSGKETEFINIDLINTPGEFSWKNSHRIPFNRFRGPPNHESPTPAPNRACR